MKNISKAVFALAGLAFITVGGYVLLTRDSDFIIPFLISSLIFAPILLLTIKKKLYWSLSISLSIPLGYWLYNLYIVDHGPYGADLDVSFNLLALIIMAILNLLCIGGVLLRSAVSGSYTKGSIKRFFLYLIIAILVIGTAIFYLSVNYLD